MFGLVTDTVSHFTLAIVCVTLYREFMTIVILAVNDWLYSMRSIRLETVCIMVNVAGWYFMNSWHVIDNSWLVVVNNILGLLVINFTSGLYLIDFMSWLLVLNILLVLRLMMNGNPLFMLAGSLLNYLMNGLYVCLFVKESIMWAFVHVLMLDWPKFMIFLMGSVSWGKMQVGGSRLELITVVFLLVIILVLM